MGKSLESERMKDEILRRTSAGESSPEIAKALGIKPQVVYYHINKLREEGRLPVKRVAPKSDRLEQVVQRFTDTLNARLVSIDQDLRKLDDEIQTLSREKQKVYEYLENVGAGESASNNN